MPDSAILRDGSRLNLGDEVITNYHESCIGKTFIVCNIIPHAHCESGTLVTVHLKGDEQRKMLGFKKEGMDFSDGIDANWFKKI